MDPIQKNNFLAVYSLVAELYTEDKHCDVIIEVEDKVFRSHCVLLAAISEYFDIMFGGSFKEGKSKLGAGEPIVLHGIDASAFHEVLQFLYKGRIQITDSNVHTLLSTSDFLRLRVSYIEEECIKFLKNSAKPVSNALEIMALAFVTGKKILIDLLSAHIFKHLNHFCGDTKFLDVSFDCLNAILKNKQRLSPNNEDALLQIICRWINHSRQERRQYRSELMKNIDVSKLSSPYIASLIEEYENFIDEVVTAESGATQTPAFFDAYPTDGNDIEISESQLHVFTKSSTRSRNIVKIFSFDKSANTWSLSSEFDSTSTSMSNIVLNNSLYCLAYDCYDYPPHLPNSFSCQTFTVHESISAPARRFLTNPPILMSRFELCGMQNNIYAYNKSLFHSHDLDIVRNISERNSSFSREDLLRDLFHYNCELDKWFPFPVPAPSRQMLFHHDVSSLTVANNTLYFVGSESDSDFIHMQAYDSRIGKWSALSGTPVEFGSSYYKQIQSCSNQDNIYIAGCSGRQVVVHMYDLLAGKWKPEPVIMWDSAKYGSCRFLSYDNEIWMIPLSRPMNIEIYDPISQEVNTSWSLEDTIRKFGKSPYIIDAVVF